MAIESEERLILHCPNIVALCVDAYDAKRQEGRLYHQYIAEPICFTSLMDALRRMDRFYDAIQFPFASTEPRSFFKDRKKTEQRSGGSKNTGQESAECRRAGQRDVRRKAGGNVYEFPKDRRKDIKVMETFDHVIGHRGTDATFVIRVQHRQHSSWQGEVTWVDGQKKEYFRSALELVRLIDGALGGPETENPS